jgi:hypothetical protein
MMGIWVQRPAVPSGALAPSPAARDPWGRAAQRLWQLQQHNGELPAAVPWG